VPGISRKDGLHGVQFSNLAVFVPDEFFGHDREITRVLTKDGRSFFLSVIDAEDIGPLRPGVVGGPFIRGAIQDLELCQRSAPVA
jgi:hypothetical protein